MRLRRDKLIILAALLGFWAMIALIRWPGAAPPQVTAALTDTKATRVAAGKLGELPHLKLGLLTIPQEPYKPEAASIFGAPPPPPPPPPPVAAVQAAAPAPAPALPPAPPPPDPFLEAAKLLRFVGFLKSDVTASAFITQGTELYILAAGDTMAGRFRVVSVQEDTVTLASPEGDKQVRLALAAGGGAGAVPSKTVTPVLESRVTRSEAPAEAVAQGAAASAVVDPAAAAVIREAPDEAVAQGEAASAGPDPLAAAAIRERAERAARIGSRTRGLPQQ